jgi:hypothetical protein
MKIGPLGLGVEYPPRPRLSKTVHTPRPRHTRAQLRELATLSAGLHVDWPRHKNV